MEQDGPNKTPSMNEESAPSGVTRRSFLGSGVAAAFCSGAASGEAQPVSSRSRPDSFVDLLRAPDIVTAFREFQKTVPTGEIVLGRHGDTWERGDVSVRIRPGKEGLGIDLSAPTTALSLVHLRWRSPVAPELLVLGDAWERSYGELSWQHLVPQRPLPWYFATSDGHVCHGYGVRTDARALSLWQIGSEGVSLWLNVTNGGSGVELGSRRITLATVMARRGEPDEGSFAAVRALCRQMCARPTRPVVPIYGANDWCYSYGHSTAESILRDTEFTAELSPAGLVRPFSVIDGGWENGTPSWPDMGRLAANIKQHQVRPGIWTRPLEAPATTSRGLLLPDARFGERTGRARELAYDPTVPEAQEQIGAKLRQLSGWGYEMIKHDFSTYDLLGQWGFEMGPQPTLPGWSLHDRSRTNAEVVSDLYHLLREAAGPSTLLDGCNTIGHLGQGIFDLQRTGDDTSGREWERTRRMGVNTLGFRLPQHGAFFIQDADVVGITEAIPWELNRQWLDALARSGTATVVSAGPPAHGPEQKAALREAFAMAAAGGAGATPQDWMSTSAPWQWAARSGADAGRSRRYQWSGPQGTSPFLGG